MLLHHCTNEEVRVQRIKINFSRNHRWYNVELVNLGPLTLTMELSPPHFTQGILRIK